MSDTHSNTVSYVRDTMLDQQEPPVTERGRYQVVARKPVLWLAQFRSDDCLLGGDFGSSSLKSGHGC